MKASDICSRYEALKSLRKNLDQRLQEIETYVVPFRGEFNKDQTSEHETQWRRPEIYDSTACVACNLLASQVQGSMTSPANKWFALRYRDDDLNQDIEAKRWLEDSEERVWQALLDSDFNTEASEFYLDLASFGTAVIMMEEEDQLQWRGLDFTTLPMQDTYFETDIKGKPVAVFRRLRFSTQGLLNRWPQVDPNDLKVSDKAKDPKDVEDRHEVVFCVYYREGKENADTMRPLPKTDRPVGYQYILKNKKLKLEEGGYYEFPAMVGRWQKVAGSRWGYSPAHVCLSDIKQLNELVAQTSEARAKAIDPPYLTTERGIVGDLDLEPGGLTMTTDMDQLAPLVSPTRFDQAIEERTRLQDAIRSSFYIDRLELKESPEMTATEVNARRENIRRMMAPVVGRIQHDFLEPLIVSTFKMLARQGQLKEQPEQVAGREMDIEYTGELARAQKAEVSMGIEAWLGTVAALAEMFPNATDLPNIDEAIKQIGLQRGVPAKVFNSQSDIDAIREARAEREAKMEEAARIQAGGEALKAAGEGAQAAGMMPGQGLQAVE